MSVSIKSPANLVLIGYRGSGKTTLARVICQRLNWGLMESDEQVVAAAGQSIREIFARHGEGHFRKLESEAVARAAGLHHHVISLGGGAVLAEANRAHIRRAGNAVIYLRADPAELWRRIQNDPATAAMRPNLTALAGGEAEIRALLAQREPIYRELATVEVDVTGKSPEMVADDVLRMFEFPT